MRPLQHLAMAEDDELAEARAASDAKSLGERAAEAVEWLCVCVADHAARATSRAELEAMLTGEPPIALAERLGRVRRDRPSQP